MVVGTSRVWSAAQWIRTWWEAARDAFKLFNRGASNGADGIFKRIEMCGILKRNDFRSLDRLFPFIAGFIDQSMKWEKMAPIMRAPMRYSENVTNVTEDVGLRALLKEDLSSLKCRVELFKKMLVEAIDEHCNSGLHVLKYHLFFYMVGRLPRLGTLSVLDISL